MKQSEFSSLRRNRKLPARYAGIVMPLVLSVFMSCIVSGISTLSSIGLVDGVGARWMGAWGMSWLVAFPTLILVLPIVRRVVAMIVQSPAR
ncbi:MAG TPA: DUF2798 domain-containing protein [Alphaproteobacteria bacterium]|nr:DUF2798 domain-containing protein [Alphaproteobacteria bacterium]